MIPARPRDEGRASEARRHPPGTALHWQAGLLRPRAALLREKREPLLCRITVVELTKDGRVGFTINVGDDRISSFSVEQTWLRLVDRVSSGGPTGQPR